VKNKIWEYYYQKSKDCKETYYSW